MRLKIIAKFIGLGLLFPYTFSLAAPQIVTSIQPLASLAAGITKDITTPQALLPSSASPHNFNLSPSQIKALNEADLIIWIGPALESFLAKPIHIIKSQPKTILTLLEQPTIKKLPLREDKNWADIPLDTPASKKKGPAPVDPHIWLSVDNAMIITHLIANELMVLDVENAHIYDNNRDEQINKLTLLKKQLGEQLKPIQKIPYLVFHDGYQYFEKEFKLNAIGAIAIHPEQPISAKKLSTLQEQIKRLKPICIFTEPQFKPKIVKSLEIGTSLKIGELDAYGTAFADPTYKDIMEFNAKNLVNCLL